ncbi:MAG TPA: protocatechuate 3,4-dioxygenase subunit alpha [Acidimicrobiia bacterium]|nr:protocatechuate 3,4-dioxygenase subunit alpha [Acidimicrobiia bacterium]
MSPMLGQTPSQTVGPYFSMRLGGEGENVLAPPVQGGERIVVTGKVFDGDGRPIEDALLEFWQANPLGRYHHPDDQRNLSLDPAFTGFARAMTDFKTGVYRLETVKPGRVPDLEGDFQAPHISVIVQARGMLNPVFTRLYFSDEATANEDDLVLRNVARSRRHTLIADLAPDSDPKLYEFNVSFQGENETVFFDF